MAQSRPHERINLAALDALRGMLAVYVLFGHSRWLLWEGHSAWNASSPAWWEYPLAYSSAMLRYGHEIVMVFFLLSGLFIHMPSARSLAEGTPRHFDVADFARRRALRLIPPYAFALVLTVLVDALGHAWFPGFYENGIGDADIDATIARTGYGWTSVAAALLLLPGSLGTTFGTNGPLWSLAYEMVYYVLYPLWFLVRMRSAVAAYAVVPALCLAGAAVAPSSFASSVIGLWPVWIAGAGFCELLTRNLRPAMPLVVSLLTACAGFVLLHLKLHPAILPLAYILFASGTVLAVSSLGTATANRWPMRFLEWLGVRSYSIYILHFPMIAFTAAAAVAIYGQRPSQGWFGLFAAIVVLAICCVGFELCEKHFLRRRRPISPPPGAALASSTANATPRQNRGFP